MGQAIITIDGAPLAPATAIGGCPWRVCVEEIRIAREALTAPVGFRGAPHINPGHKPGT
jgi:hypothetical protein